MNAAKIELAALIRRNRERLETIRCSIEDALDRFEGFLRDLG